MSRPPRQSHDITGLQQAAARAVAHARDVNHAWALARQAWDAGLPVTELSRLLAVERSTIRRFAKRHGWPKRAPGRRAGPRGALSMTCPNCGTSVTFAPRVRVVP